ncbi:VanW family protein [Paenibacillus algicola]|uniref:VanW family protein n=1 Tax=Paenibacillus algicola TaxID=2565926 RepID=A0A4P8XPF2_9BACL|nr:VanW family protein [Paenibacillus algicola]QCT04528.1 VanW family protein [Paenibacillus algicola]
MKKIHVMIIASLSLLLAGCLIYGALSIYVNTPRLPAGTTLSGWSVGGQPDGDVLNELERRLAALEQLPLSLMGWPRSGEEKLTLGEAGVTYRAEAFKAAVSQLQEGTLWERAFSRYTFAQAYSLEVHQDLELLKQRLNESWEQEQFGKPVNAVRTITGDEVRYIPEQSVLRIQWPLLEASFAAALPRDFAMLDAGGPLSIELPLQLQSPEVTVATLRAEGIQRKIIQFSTSLGASGPGRVHNITAAAAAVDGMILKPGEVFDYAKVVAQARKQHGFREAPVIISGKLVPGVGGGICQVSSTIYNAVLLTGLEVVERRNHSLPVNYLPKGLDATYAEGYINFRFRNSTGKHLLLQAQVVDKVLTVKLFGTFPDNIVYSLDTKLVEQIPAPRSYVRDSSLPPGQQKLLQPGKPGYVIETYRSKQVNGKIVERERLSRDVYKGQSSLIGMNPSHGEIPGTQGQLKAPVVEDGVSSP